ncbi:hypothetical protein ACR8AL_10920 [Clavibacter sepedonicus]|uniref:Uncharacterized protein n=1 Tax=Clavibacter sepedonicus TaxID=31964 RepID=B0RI53_CLASE|nr:MULTISPECIES: hypothetical protein [Clavibacter]MBD5382266.1 hypothetical protein [Clavibacter sp.]OQJ48186.1 hypothetical protein B5P19_07765 [Clavibacter sepedonicus]OQJ54567.1 hypothetical protein B5P20_11015 [Clavibacter sepedonicus]UUK66136.1 nucleoside 2-deoxyribosyltransferase [Clavibacter sepedonicus]CAQ02624.1 hypothetical protein CMS2542 [Clavibacter sepedonicus]
MSTFFVAGSWRNREAVGDVVAALDAVGVRSYCFVRAAYDADAAVFAAPGGADDADLDDPGIRRLFEQDLAALRAADRFVLVLPAGAAAHMEAGIAVGLGKPCVAVGAAERTETLHLAFEAMCAGPTGRIRHLRDTGAVG